MRYVPKHSNVDEGRNDPVVSEILMNHNHTQKETPIKHILQNGHAAEPMDKKILQRAMHLDDLMDEEVILFKPPESKKIVQKESPNHLKTAIGSERSDKITEE